jgi:ribosomal-protein-alanine N-acetyltransferase
VSIELVPASSVERAVHAAVFNEGYSDYLVPFHIDEAALANIVDVWDVDLHRSRIALQAGEPVGFANLAVRGSDSWIGGVGVVPSARRQGIARMLMEAVIEEAPGSVSLEVIEENVAASTLYEQLGFVDTRLLEVWSLPEVAEVPLRSVEPSPLGQRDLPWQRADASLPADYERLEVDGGAMLIKGGNVLQLEARDLDAATALLSRGKQLTFVNVPEGDVASAALALLGGELRLRQREMLLAR